MRLPPSDPETRDHEGRLPLQDVLTVLKRHDVSVTIEETDEAGRACCVLVSDLIAEVYYLPPAVGGMMIETLARKFAIPKFAFYDYHLRKKAEAHNAQLLH